MTEKMNYIGIQDLDLSQRCKNVLMRNGIMTLGDLEKYNPEDLIKVKGINKITIEEIAKLNTRLRDIDKKFENRQEKINNTDDDVYMAKISQINLSERAYHALIKANILTVKDLIKMSVQDISNLRGLGEATKEEISNAIEKILLGGQEYIEVQKRIFSGNKDLVDEEYEGKGFDFDVIFMLADDFSVPYNTMAQWFGFSRQRLSQVIKNPSSARRQKWTGKELSKEEWDLLSFLIQGKKFECKDDEVQCLCFNNKKDNFVSIFIYENEIKCFLMDSLPEDLQTMIRTLNMQKYTARELSGGVEGKVVYIFKEPYFAPDNREAFYSCARSRNMTVREYSEYISGYPFAFHNRMTDERIINFFEKSMVNGKVHFNSSKESQCIRRYATENGYKIKDFVEFYGYECYDEKNEFY